MLLIYMGQSTAESERLSEVEQEQILREYRACPKHRASPAASSCDRRSTRRRRCGSKTDRR
jgi:hypothetical protein